MIDNFDQRSKIVAKFAASYRPGYADHAKMRLPRPGGGRSSAREITARIAAGSVATPVIPKDRIRACFAELSGDYATTIDRAVFQ